MFAFREAVYIRGRVRSLCTGLRERLKEYVFEFPDGSPLDLIRILELFLDEMEASLAATGDINELRFYIPVIQELAGVLTWLDNAHSAQTPRGLVQILDRTSQSLFQDVKLLVVPSSEYNYSIADLVPPLKKLAKGPLPRAAQERLEKALPKKFYLVQFPRIQREHILNHAIFGHEFGHPIADDFIEIHETQTAYQQRFQDAKRQVEADPAVVAHLNQIHDVVERGKELSDIADAISEIHRRAIQELVSDATSIQLFGPSAAFALLDLLLTDELDTLPSEPGFYPPSRFRLRLIESLLNSTGHDRALRTLALDSTVATIGDSTRIALDHLRGVIATTTDHNQINSDPIVKAAYEWLDKTLPEAIAYAERETAKSAYHSSLVESEVPELLKRLQLKVPPNETGLWPDVEVADWRSALTAGWLHALNHALSTAATDEAKDEGITSIQELTLKGVEYAILQAAYTAHRASKA